MSKESEMHKTGWTNIELPPHLKKARGEKGKEIAMKKEKDSTSSKLYDTNSISWY